MSGQRHSLASNEPGGTEQPGGGLPGSGPGSGLPRKLWGPLFAVISVLAAYSLTVGYVYPAVAFNLSVKEFSPLVIGLQSAMSGVGILAGSVLTARIASLASPWATTLIALGVSAGVIIALGLIPPVAIWFFLRFALGFSGSLLFILSETWINQLAPDHLRGRIIGIYTSVLAGVFALGPALTTVLGFDGWQPFTSVALLLIAMGLPLLIYRRELPNETVHEEGAFTATLKRIPVLMLGVGAFGYFDGALLTLWPVYALDRDIGVDAAAWLLTLLIIGNLFLQVPIGWLADRFSRRSLFTLCASFAFFGALMLPLVDLTATYAYVYLVIWGALSFGIYTLAMTIVGEALRGSSLVAANAGFGVMWGFGAVAGSGVTGAVMNAIGAVGLPVCIAVVFGALMITSLFFPPIRIATGSPPRKPSADA
ncbi:MAG: MFS transporter [Pseudomonadota bacterium]